MSSATHLLLFGPPGSGKSTQGVLLSQHLHLPHISLGEVFRDEVDSGSERGQRIASQMSGGALVNSDDVVDLLRAALEGKSGFILDGFPRSEEQLPLLEQLFADLGIHEYLAIDLDVPMEISRERLSQRGRRDDKPEVIERRLHAYQLMAAPVMAYFGARDVLAIVDGAGTVEQVAERIRAAIQRKLPGATTSV